MDGTLAEVNPLALTRAKRSPGDILLPAVSEVLHTMRRSVALLIFTVAISFACTAQTNAPSNWKAKLNAAMPLLGHRNWILVVDSAYPLQSSPGVETIETNADMIDVVQSVLNTIDRSIHIRPDLYMDAELPFVPEQDAPGVTSYRSQIAKALSGRKVESVLHDKIIADIAQTGSQFHVLVLKTNLAIPYTSVFIRLDCKYWSSDAEKRMREKMSASQPAFAR